MFQRKLRLLHSEPGQVTLFTTPVQAVHTHESKFLVFCSAEVDFSPLSPIAIAEIVQTETWASLPAAPAQILG